MMQIQYPFLDLSEVNRQYMAQLHEAALRVIDSGRYIGGSEVELFEKSWQRPARQLMQWGLQAASTRSGL